jgi:hypothetical protein
MLRVLVALPVPLFGLVCGREWFAEPGATTSAVSGDILLPRASPRESHNPGLNPA